MHPGALHPVHHPVHPVKAVAVAVAVATLELTHHPGTRAAPRQTSCREERYMSPDRRTTGYVAEAAARAAAEPERSVLTPQVDPSVTATPAAPGAPVPDLGRTSEAIGRPASRSVQVTILTALARSEEHTSELQSRGHLVCRLLLEKKKKNKKQKQQHKRQKKKKEKE